ncbi:putative ATP-dependent RNA helicase DHR1 [Pseudogymnoascus australis]
MKKFVPRQRKHKVIARTKDSSKNPYDGVPDSNAVEIIPTAKAELDEKKRLLREELKKEGAKMSGKKAKRLEKYIDTKLKKDENRILIQNLAATKTDTSLYSSSSRMGQGKESKRQRMGRALREAAAGIDMDGQNDEILFEKRVLKDGPVEGDSDEEVEDDDEVSGAAMTTTEGTSNETKAVPFTSAAGSGLKRPLELDDTGRPVIQKRQKRGGVNSKLSFKAEPKATTTAKAELAWTGFSESEDSEDDNEEDSDSDSDSDMSDSELGPSIAGDKSTSEGDEATSDGEDGSEESSDESGSEDNTEDKKERSSAFKSWANQQRNEAMGFEPTNTTQLATLTPKIENFQPRPLESDPLPAELQTANSIARKAFAVSFNRSAEIQEARMQLPVVGEEQKIMEAIHNNSTVVVFGATGSGKTTQVPQFLYEAGYGSPDSPTPGMIGVTQPRRVAAVSMAKRVGDELGDHGDRVAYQIRFEGTVSPKTAIKFMTDGVLLREVALDIALRKYSAVVIDEAHERSVNTDILIGMMSRVVRLRDEMALEDPSIKPLKLVIMSATLRITDFTENKTLFTKPPPVVQAEGRQFTVTNHFARQTRHDYVEELFKKITKAHKKLPPGGFLVFLTGQNEITHLSKKLKETFKIGTMASGPQVRISGQDAPAEAEDVDFGGLMEEELDSDDESVDFEGDDNDDAEFDVGEAEEVGPAKMHVLPLYSLLPTKEQLRVFEPPPDGSRLVILATNVAETSLTIPGIRYVFDCGRSKERKYDEKTGVQSFEISWISKASASQRAGRAGRTAPGHCYRMYSSAVFERDFREFAEPEILRMPIEGVGKPCRIREAPDIPLGHIPNRPNHQGRIHNVDLPALPRFARILLIGHLHGCLPYTIALVAGLSTSDIFIPENQVVPALTPKDDQDEDSHFTQADRLEEDARNAIRRKYNSVQHAFCSLDDRSDAIKLLQAVGEFAHEPTEAWCHAHYVRYKVLKEILQLRRQITDLLRTNIPAFAGLTFVDKLPPPSVTQIKALKQMVAAGFIDHVAIRADLAPIPPPVGRKPSRAIEVQYLTLFPSHARRDDEDKAVYIHPSSPLAHRSPKECPEYIVYSHLQRAAPSTPERVPRARMHALVDVSGGQLAALAKGTPLLHYGKPIKEGKQLDKLGLEKECWVVPYLRAEGKNDMGWPLPARKVVQKKVMGKGWVIQG